MRTEEDSERFSRDHGPLSWSADVPQQSGRPRLLLIFEEID